MRVRSTGGPPNALAGMLADQLEASTATPRPACVGIRAVDLGLSATVLLSGEGASVNNGIDKERVRVRIVGDAASLLELTEGAGRSGIPAPWSATGRRALRILLRRRVRLRGAGRHPLDLLRVARALGSS